MIMFLTGILKGWVNRVVGCFITDLSRTQTWPGALNALHRSPPWASTRTLSCITEEEAVNNKALERHSAEGDITLLVSCSLTCLFFLSDLWHGWSAEQRSSTNTHWKKAYRHRSDTGTRRVVRFSGLVIVYWLTRGWMLWGIPVLCEQTLS